MLKHLAGITLAAVVGFALTISAKSTNIHTLVSNQLQQVTTTSSRTAVTQLPPQVIAALTTKESEDPGTANKNSDEYIRMVKSWLHQCRRNGCLPKRVPLVKAYMARFEISWNEVGSTPQEIRDMWFQRSFELLAGARRGSNWHLQYLRDYLDAGPEYLTLESIGTSKTELRKMEQGFIRQNGA